MKRILWTLAVLGYAPQALAADLHELDAECEAALALSAAPAHMRAEAGVLLLDKHGFVEHRAPGNGYLCLVERNHERSVIPQCFDAASRDTHVVVITDEARLLRQGHSFAEVAERRRQLAADGKLQPARRPGVVYMMSDFNYIYSADNDTMLKVAPHVMFHAPGLSNADIASSPAAAVANAGVPFVTAEGPQGFMVSFTAKAADSTDVLRACAGQLPANDDLQAFPPRG